MSVVQSWENEADYVCGSKLGMRLNHVCGSKLGMRLIMSVVQSWE